MFAATLLTSAALMFVLEPMFAKMVLPHLGGTPAVWNTCLFFYQAMLLAGYLYVHLSVKWLGVRRQALMHLGLLCVPWVVMPIGISGGWIPPVGTNPVPALLALLTVSAGLPFLAVAASAPMLQMWFAHTNDRAAPDPYFLYAASNAGSLIGLLCYPLVIEPILALREQSLWWSAGYGLFMALTAACAAALLRSPGAGAAPAAMPGGAKSDRERAPAGRPAGWLRRLRWLALSLAPSSLLFGVTTYISTDLVSIPLLWAIPLALYLLSFALVFSRRKILPHRLMVRAQPLLIVVAAASLYMVRMGALAPYQAAPLFILHLLAFFATAMVCHGELAADRPSPEEVTGFYLWIAFGGMLGGLFNALAAPLLFPTPLEYPLMMIAAVLLQPRVQAPGARWPALGIVVPCAILLVCGGIGWAVSAGGAHSSAAAAWARFAAVAVAALGALLVRRRPAPFGLSVAVVLAVGALCSSRIYGTLHTERSFFAIHRVEYDPWLNCNRLVHGSTAHGLQSRESDLRREPLAYYHFDGPLGRIFDVMGERPEFGKSGRIGIVGLGAGAIAAYGRAGQTLVFYEIDPAVERIARNEKFFTYLADCRAKTEVILGDARVSLARGSPRQFDLLIVDAFNSDSIPVHLLTREAIRLYFDRLADNGVLALHISNRYLDLAPVLGNLAEQVKVVALVCDDLAASRRPGKFTSIWAVMARRRDDLGKLNGDAAWRPMAARRGRRPWTDDYSNVVGAIKRGGGFGRLWSPLTPERDTPERDETDAFGIRGVELFNLGHLDKAAECFRKVINNRPNDFISHASLGAILLQQGKADEAVQLFRRAVEINPAFADGHVQLGSALVQQGDVAGGIAHLEKAIALDPRNAEAHRQLGHVCAGQNKAELAVAHYRLVLETNPRDAQTLSNIGVVLWRQQGKRDEGIAYFRKALEADPGYAAARRYLDLALNEKFFGTGTP